MHHRAAWYCNISSRTVRQVAARKEAFGVNEVEEEEPDAIWVLAWEALQDPSLVFLCLAAVVSFLIGFTFHQAQDSLEVVLLPSPVLFNARSLTPTLTLPLILSSFPPSLPSISVPPSSLHFLFLPLLQASGRCHSLRGGSCGDSHCSQRLPQRTAVPLSAAGTAIAAALFRPP